MRKSVKSLGEERELALGEGNEERGRIVEIVIRAFPRIVPLIRGTGLPLEGKEGREERREKENERNGKEGGRREGRNKGTRLAKRKGEKIIRSTAM